MTGARWAISAVTGLLWIGVAAGGCEGEIGIAPPIATGSAGAAATTSTTSEGGGDAQCTIPDDGVCDDPQDCDCAVCKPGALCQPEGNGCVRDYWCLATEDACTCSDCDRAGMCHASHVDDCNEDGTCDFTSEGCGCSDCWSASSCVDNQIVCDGGAPDGVCDPLYDDCACNDCLGRWECLCPDDVCPWDVCVCPGCWEDSWCNDPVDCKDDGVCAWDEWEGCHCADCAPLPSCAGYPG